MSRGRLILTLVLAAYGLYYLLVPGHYGLFDCVDLGIHETGHIVFGPFGEFIGALGGTLLQLLFPLCFVWYFWRRGDRHAATVAGWWVAQNFWNVAVYVQNAQAEELPLVGGGVHDWPIYWATRTHGRLALPLPRPPSSPSSNLPGPSPIQFGIPTPVEILCTRRSLSSCS